MNFELLLKLFISFLLLINNDIAYTFYSWGTRSEIAQILNSSLDFENNLRISHLVEKKRDLWWHLRDPYIGIIFHIDQAHYPSWNFSLWDYFQQRGKGFNVAMVEGEGVSQPVNENNIDEMQANSQQEAGKQFCNQMHSDIGVRSIFFNEKNDNLGLFHKNVSIDLMLQIAPHANYVIYGIMDKKALAHSSDLQKSLSLIAKNGFQLVCLGLKITNSQDMDIIDKELEKIPYIVAASGNDGLIEQEEAYPASSKHVAFNVGSYDRNHNICDFSQFSSFEGPKIVAPGSDILAQFDRNKYTLIHGTSASAAILTGFLALVLAEFKNDFTYQEIIYIIYNSTISLQNNKQWKKKVVLGAIDMRTAALCFHVLKKVKSRIKPILFKKLFQELVQQLVSLNYVISTKKASLQSIHKQLICFAENKEICSFFELMTEMLLKTCNVKSKKRKFQDLFDNKVVCLLRNSIKDVTDQPCKKASDQAKHKIQYILNRQK